MFQKPSTPGCCFARRLPRNVRLHCMPERRGAPGPPPFRPGPPPPPMTARRHRPWPREAGKERNRVHACRRSAAARWVAANDTGGRGWRSAALGVILSSTTWTPCATRRRLLPASLKVRILLRRGQVQSIFTVSVCYYSGPTTPSDLTLLVGFFLLSGKQCCNSSCRRDPGKQCCNDIWKTRL